MKLCINLTCQIEIADSFGLINFMMKNSLKFVIASKSVLICCTGADYHKKIICKSVLTIKITDLGLTGKNKQYQEEVSKKGKMYIYKYHVHMQILLFTMQSFLIKNGVSLSV